MDRFLFAGIVHGIHALMVLAWFSLFFIPLSVWPSRLVVQFYWLLVVACSQFFWSMYLFAIRKRLHVVCPLTSLEQYCRTGSCKQQVGDTFIYELCRKYKVPVGRRTASLVSWFSFLFVFVRGL